MGVVPVSVPHDKLSSLAMALPFSLRKKATRTTGINSPFRFGTSKDTNQPLPNHSGAS